MSTPTPPLTPSRPRWPSAGLLSTLIRLLDLVLLSTVTNMFDAQTNRDLMHRIRPVLAPGGRVAIVSYMRDRGVVGAVFGVQMLVSTDAGDAHAASDHLAWLADAGFEDCSVTDLTDPPLTLVVGRRR